MKVNSIAAMNFKSKVKVMDTFYGKPEGYMSAKDIAVFKRAVEKIEKNGKKDTVEIFFALDNNDEKIGLKVQKDKGSKRFEGREVISRFYKELKEQDILDAYDKASKMADYKTTPVQRSVFDKYI